jgi:hypothetical protein
VTFNEAQRASVGSTEARNGRLARVGVVGPKRARAKCVTVLGPALATGDRRGVSIGLAATGTFVVLSAYIQVSFRGMNGWWMEVLEALLVLTLPFALCFMVWFAVRFSETAHL